MVLVLSDPPTDSPLRGRTVVMSGGSRGIGLAIAIELARAGANIALMAKTDQPHDKLPGTVHTAAQAVRDVGGQAVAVIGDVREADDVQELVDRALDAFGAVDIVVNNASAMHLAALADTDPKRLDLMLDVNIRGTFLLTRAALPHLRRSEHGHVLTLGPPLEIDRRWLGGHAPYTLSKLGMTMLTLGLAVDEAEHGVAANCLWPRTLIATAAVQFIIGEDALASSRRPEIMADAARVILESDPRVTTGRTYIDDDVLTAAGRTDLSIYDTVPGSDLRLDLFVDDWTSASDAYP